MMTLTESEKVHIRMRDLIPGGVNSPVRAFKEIGISPMIVESGQGAIITNCDGEEFIDYCGSWGALLHGHAHPLILAKIQERMQKGTTFGISCAIEEKFAAKVIETVDSVEKIRFVSSGTEATMSAVRLARGYTGRDLIVKFNGHYHGHADYFLVSAGSGVTGISSTSSSAGIPQGVVKDIASLPFNNEALVREFLQKNPVAAVILEPTAANMGVVPAKPGFLQMLREETERQGALLIFDEVITGFRLSLGGAQALFGIKPDLTCFSKILGGGLPVGAFGGRREIMDLLAPLGPVYQAGTLSGNPLAMEAGLQAISLAERAGFYKGLEEKTLSITEPVQELIKKRGTNASLQRAGSMFTIFFGATSLSSQEEVKRLNAKIFSAFFQHMYRNGVYPPPSQYEAWFVSAAHEKDHLQKTRDLILSFIKELS